eukprot:CAMPEP_0198154908 /NCGR_PEP_ID=MMETSP1443-20131203/68855_1 /TAXON_ID=186043 /ORGANISM="Entomoneis sp., Strain CCMP2396" /LENGTH=626 /DNA_ID=CAMNT_0043821625 /DNA_START=9 /DNA_END=1889 /DNA_ORIENTATION=-
MSSHTDSKLGTAPVEAGPMLESVRGRKSIHIEASKVNDTTLEETISTDIESDFNHSDEESDDEEEDEEWEERLRILNDSHILKEVACFFLHPEAPIGKDAFACARCYFDRASAPVVQEEEGEERARIFEETKALKSLAVDYMHPELPVKTTDPTIFGRNYFSRPSAPEQEQQELAEEREYVLAEAKQLKKLAVDYMHPERPVVTEDPTLFGRNYFSRYSAEEQEMGPGERDLVLNDMKQLKKFAVHYMHPELPVVTEDPTLFGRNYFTRASAPSQENDVNDRDMIMEDMKQLRKLAIDYMHPERPVVTEDQTLFGRNYFCRASAPEQEDMDVTEERERVLAEMEQLKKLAVDYMHPEHPVITADPTLFGRNYFCRASAPEQGDMDVIEERERVLAEMLQLKQLAVNYMHPEHPIFAVDSTLFGRNYFCRASAPEQEYMDVIEERERVLAEMKQLKKLAVDYLHPEHPVVTADPALFGRNYFCRASAPEQEYMDVMEERDRVLAEMEQLKKLAVEYMHPERPVTTEDPSAMGRNYFGRAGARMHDYMVHSFPAHEEDAHHEEHYDDHHMGHFGMCEDGDFMFDDMREEFEAVAAAPMPTTGKESGEDGNLSRSPSSVMLFTGNSAYD